jgi:hypothetical protein
MHYPEKNSDLRLEKLVTDRLSYGTTFDDKYFQWNKKSLKFS